MDAILLELGDFMRSVVTQFWTPRAGDVYTFFEQSV